METRLAKSYREAESIARSRARNFYYSFLVLPHERRLALCAVYSFMRYCDDISDGPGAIDHKRMRLERWRAQLNSVVAGELQGNGILPAFRDSVQRFSIPAKYFHWIIDGAEMDLGTDRYEAFEDLYRYCFRVASAVGLVCIRIFGFEGETAELHAEECGIAFQLTNILRDVKEDARMGRVYLPAEDLRRFQYPPEDLMEGVYDERFRELMKFEADRARSYYDRARALLPMIEEGSRPSLWAMMEIYERILERIVRRRYDVFNGRIRLSGGEKASILLRALAMRYVPFVQS